MSIPPIFGPAPGIPLCPTGYVYNAATQMCDPVSTAPVNMNDPTIRKLVTELGETNIDPVQAAKNHGVGLVQSGYTGSIALDIWTAFWRAAAYSVKLYFEAYDRLIAFIADQISAAVTRDIPGFWILVGSLISDILQVEVDGHKIFQDLQARGTMAAMVDTGGSLLDLLVGEFTNTANGVGGKVSFNKNVNADTGLPETTLTPAGGVRGSKALVGFILSSAVRQANIDGITAPIPFGLGAAFEKYSEAMRTNLGIGRLMRFALKPYFHDLVAVPLTEAIKKQYRPTLLPPAAAISAIIQGNIKAIDPREDLARQGWSADRQDSIFWDHAKKPSRADLRDLHAAGRMQDADYLLWMNREGYTNEVTGLLDQADDLRPARGTALRVAEHFATQFLIGKITHVQLEGALDSIRHNTFGAKLLSDNEVEALKQLQSIAGAAPRRHLSVARLMLLYEDGIITLGEFEQHLNDLGYDAETVTELTQELLIQAKRRSDKEAKAIAKAAAAAAKAAGPTAGTIPPNPGSAPSGG